jgi:hypothetical protein
MVIELILAGIALVVCVALLLRMALPERHQQRVDAQWNLLVYRTRLLAHRAWFWIRHRKRAAREAEEAIQRAQRKVERDGNVIRPDGFKGPRKPH